MIRAKFRSVLVEESDNLLRSFDRQLRKVLSKHFPEWPPGDALPPASVAGARSLILIYHSLWIAQRGERLDAIADLRNALAMGEAPKSIEGRAAQFLAMNLYALSIDETLSERPESGEEFAKQCRSVCEHAFEEYAPYGWFHNLSYALHVSLGIVEYYEEEKESAKAHFEMAIKEWENVSRGLDRSDSGTIGLGHMYLGDVLLQEGDARSTRRHYRKAARLLEGIGRIEVLVRIGSLILDEGESPAKAERLLRRALHEARGLDVRPDLIDELKCELAWIRAHRGRYGEAERIYREVAATTKNERRKVTIEGFLEQFRGRGRQHR
jgi:tetratricopeptide (TPR) repeat protein